MAPPHRTPRATQHTRRRAHGAHIRGIGQFCVGDVSRTGFTNRNKTAGPHPKDRRARRQHTHGTYSSAVLLVRTRPRRCMRVDGAEASPSSRKEQEKGHGVRHTRAPPHTQRPPQPPQGHYPERNAAGGAVQTPHTAAPHACSGHGTARHGSGGRVQSCHPGPPPTQHPRSPRIDRGAPSHRVLRRRTHETERKHEEKEKKEESTKQNTETAKAKIKDRNMCARAPLCARLGGCGCGDSVAGPHPPTHTRRRADRQHPWHAPPQAHNAGDAHSKIRFKGREKRKYGGMARAGTVYTVESKREKQGTRGNIRESGRRHARHRRHSPATTHGQLRS